MSVGLGAPKETNKADFGYAIFKVLRIKPQTELKIQHFARLLSQRFLCQNTALFICSHSKRTLHLSMCSFYISELVAYICCFEDSCHFLPLFLKLLLPCL